jgi:hypothetical protein
VKRGQLFRVELQGEGLAFCYLELAVFGQFCLQEEGLLTNAELIVGGE